MTNPSLLKGRHPALVENILKDTPGWQVEKLGRGSQVGNGWVFRQYTPAGNPTGQQLRWHPGGGHHGADPNWRVVGPNGTSEGSSDDDHTGVRRFTWPARGVSK